MGSPFLQQTTIGKSNDKFNIEFLIYVKTGKKEMGHGEAGWWMERFEVADINHNGLLNFTELKEYK